MLSQLLLYLTTTAVSEGGVVLDNSHWHVTRTLCTNSHNCLSLVFRNVFQIKAPNILKLKMTLKIFYAQLFCNIAKSFNKMSGFSTLSTFFVNTLWSFTFEQ